MEPFRIAPKAGPEAYKTYQVQQHFRPATCAEVHCHRAAHGWRSVMDTSTVDGRNKANWIRMKSGRAFTFVENGPIVTFTFAAGQRCFEKHQAPVQRMPLLRVVGGDWRGNPRGVATQTFRPRDWIDNFGEHQLSLLEAQKRG